MRRIPLVLLLVFAGCKYISFGRRMSNDEIRLQQEIRAYYGDVQRAFAAGNAQALAALFDSSIVKPMTYAQILAWGEKFFSENGPARFRIESLEFDALGHRQADVVMKYRVVTKDGKGDFGGVEADRLVKRGGRWYMTEWEKLPEKEPKRP